MASVSPGTIIPLSIDEPITPIYLAVYVSVYAICAIVGSIGNFLVNIFDLICSLYYSSTFYTDR